MILEQSSPQFSIISSKMEKISVIPSSFSVDTPYEKLPETVNQAGYLLISGVEASQAVRIHSEIHSFARAADGWRSGSRSYMWPSIGSFRIYLVKKPRERKFTVIFPVLYGPKTDVHAIVEYRAKCAKCAKCATQKNVHEIKNRSKTDENV